MTLPTSDLPARNASRSDAGGRSPASEMELDFGDMLPAGVDSFALHWVAGRFGGTVKHWFNLARAGAFGKNIVDLRTPGSSKAMLAFRAPG